MLIVDPATGAMYNLPNRVDVELNAEMAAAEASEFTIASIDTLTDAQRSALVALD